MSADKYPSIFLRQMEAIVYLSPWLCFKYIRPTLLVVLVNSQKTKKITCCCLCMTISPFALVSVISYMYHFQVWELLTGDEPRPSLFMAVPTIYSKLIQYHDKRNLTKQDKETVKSKCEQLRWNIVSSLIFGKNVMSFYSTLFSNDKYFIKCLKPSLSFCLG